MKISDKSITALRIIVNGDGIEGIKWPYRTGNDIELFFDEYSYEIGPGSRWFITEQYLRKINQTGEINKIIKKAFHPANFIEAEYSLKSALGYFNKYLEFDGYRVILKNKKILIEKLDDTPDLEAIKLPEDVNDDINDWLTEHSSKCKTKLAEGDFAGAITNARSMVELLFTWIIEKTEGEMPKGAEGGISKLRKEAFKRLDIDPKNVATPLQMIITGMVSTVDGLAGLRNKTSDSHGTMYKAGIRHAKLAVSNAITIVNYFSDLIIDKRLHEKLLAAEEAENEELRQAIIEQYEEEMYKRAMDDMYMMDAMEARYGK